MNYVSMRAQSGQMMKEDAQQFSNIQIRYTLSTGTLLGKP